MEENEERTLYENLEYLNETKGIIKQAIIDKGVEISADTPFREYANKIGDITTSEDLEAELSAQEQIIQEMKTALENKAAGGKVKLNIYAQTTEPTSKDGIWLQTDKAFDNVYFDTNTVKTESWDTNIFNSVPFSSSYSSSAVCVGTDIFIFVNGSNSVYKYDTLTDTYVQLNDSPMQVGSNGAVVYGTDIFLMKNSSTSSKAVYKYDILTDTYTRLSDSPYATYSARITVVDNYIYLACCAGYYHTYRYNILTDTYTRLNNPPDLNINETSVAVGGYIYYIKSNSNNNDSYKYNTLTDTYTKISRCPNIGNDSSNRITYENCIYLFGSSAVYKYDTLTDTYTNIITKKYTNNNEAIVRCSDKILLFSGRNRPNDLFKFILEGKDYDDESIVISQTFGNYHTIMDDVTNIIAFFNNVYYYTTEGGLDDTIPTYYGDGTQWVKFKN